MENATLIGYLSGEAFKMVLLLLAAIGACLAAIFTAFAARATAKANIGQTLLTCLDKYISIMKDKREAEESKNPHKARGFYRELFDLHWSEFQLWHEGAIPNHVMRAWITVRKRNFTKNEIICASENGTKEKISYADVWGDLVSTGYFELDDPFVKFMNTVHTTNITNIRCLKKETKKRKEK